MLVKMKDYSKLRGLLTKGIRHAELLLYSSKLHIVDSNLLSEVDYWITTFTMIREELYGCTEEYKGNLVLLDALEELLHDISNVYLLFKASLSKEDMQLVTIVWKCCNSAKVMVQ